MISVRKGLAAARYAAKLRFDAFFDASVRREIARDRLLGMLPLRSIGAELGVFKGEFSARLLRAVRPVELHLVDPYWTAFGEFYPVEWGAYTDYGRLGCREAYECARQTVTEANMCGARVRFHIGDDVEWLTGLPDASLDWVYIDTSHEYKHTYAELATAQNKVKLDGLICGDDWRDGDPATGVGQAIREFLVRYPYKLKYLEAGQWAIARISKKKRRSPLLAPFSAQTT